MINVRVMNPKCIALSLFVCIWIGQPLSLEYGHALAQSERRKTVSTWTYKRLEEVQADIVGERYPNALKRLAELSQRNRLNSHELALIWQMYGFTYSTLGRYVEAAEAFEKCLDQKSLTGPATQRTRYNLAQAYLGSESYSKAVSELEEWLRLTDNPKAEVHYLLAASHVQLKEFKKALAPAKQAVSMKKKPRESWLNLLMSVHFELKQLRGVLTVAKQLVSLYPKRSYWLQLSSVYNELGDTRRALATLELSYAQGYVIEENEILSLVSLYLSQGIPFKAAELLEEEMGNGRVKASLNSLKMLSSAWIQSREPKKAWLPLERASSLDETGETYARLAHLYMESEKWKHVHQVAVKAFSKGQLKKPGQLHIIDGIALLSLRQLEKAKQAFKRAESYPQRRSAARQWLNHLREQSR